MAEAFRPRRARAARRRFLHRLLGGCARARGTLWKTTRARSNRRVPRASLRCPLVVPRKVRQRNRATTTTSRPHSLRNWRLNALVFTASCPALTENAIYRANFGAETRRRTQRHIRSKLAVLRPRSNVVLRPVELLFHSLYVLPNGPWH